MTHGLFGRARFATFGAFAGIALLASLVNMMSSPFVRSRSRGPMCQKICFLISGKVSVRVAFRPRSISAPANVRHAAVRFAL